MAKSAGRAKRNPENPDSDKDARTPEQRNPENPANPENPDSDKDARTPEQRNPENPANPENPDSDKTRGRPNSEILKIPLIPKILILTKRADAQTAKS